MSYKALLDWKDYKAGDIVNDDFAEKLLQNYKKFSDQSILEKVSDDEKPKATVSKSTFKSTKSKKTVSKGTKKKKQVFTG